MAKLRIDALLGAMRYLQEPRKVTHGQSYACGENHYQNNIFFTGPPAALLAGCGAAGSYAWLRASVCGSAMRNFCRARGARKLRMAVTNNPARGHALLLPLRRK